jgi:Domain of unknown function (DUF4271)
LPRNKLSLPRYNMDSLTTQSLFTNHELIPVHKGPVVLFTDFDFGIASILLILTGVFIWLIVFRNKALRSIISVFFLSGYLSSVAQKEVKIENRMALLFFFYFVINMSLFLGNMSTSFGIKILSNTLPPEINILILLFAAYVFKVYGIRMIGYIFQIQTATQFHINTILAFHAVLGFCLFPVLVMLIFVNQLNPSLFLGLGGFLIVGLLLFRILKGINFGRNTASISDFYLFLYLCALELLPLVIVAKLISLKFTT